MRLARAFAQRFAAYLALAALSLQLALSFDHVHKHDLGFIGVDRADAISVKHARPGLQVAERLPARLADDEEHCPICFSNFLLANSSLPDAPVNPHSLQFAVVDSSLSPVSDRVFRSRHASFLSRAPPAV
ncbi:MAG: hypothetical protein ACLQDM_02315 [Bradyrhizobium sp.]